MVLRALTQFFGIFRGQRVILRKFQGQNVGWKSCGNKCNFGYGLWFWEVLESKM